MEYKKLVLKICCMHIAYIELKILLTVKSQDRRGYLTAIALADAGDLMPLASYFETLIAWSLALGIAAAVRLIELESDG